MNSFEEVQKALDEEAIGTEQEDHKLGRSKGQAAKVTSMTCADK